MCGIVGFSNFKFDKDLSLKIVSKMNKKITHRGRNEQGFFNFKDTFLGHHRLSIIDLKNGHQPMSFEYLEEKYTIVYNGEIYNANFLKKKITEKGLSLTTSCDTELVLKCYVLFKEKCLKMFNGIFAFCVFNESKNELFLARDQIGVKPLFYYFKNGKFAFASEIKSLFELPSVKPVVSKSGLCELFGIAPARTPGKTVYDNIYELKPAQFLKFKDGKISRRKYYKLKSKNHKDDTQTTVKKVRQKLENIIKSQLVSDVNIGMFLSGGVDSSIITAVSANSIKERLKTFSVDYKNNDKNFVATDFTPTRDNYFIDLMQKKYNLNHKYKVLNSADLFKNLKDALVARDVPAMADIDSSLLLFCKEVKKDVTVCLSGEFSDEIFCGYPWFYRQESLNSKTFPWAVSISLRENTVSQKLKKRLNLKNYVQKCYQQALKQVPLKDFDTEQEKIMKTFSFLTMNYFGVNLLERTDRMSMLSGLEVRVPFTDYKFVEYVYNIPWEMKNLGGDEKGILRKAFEDIVPTEIIQRKKSPYPKSNDPEYSSLVETEIRKLLKDNTNRLWEIVDKDFILKVLKGGEMKYPWFGQLMNKPQYLAFILQIEMWLKEYKIILKI